MTPSFLFTDHVMNLFLIIFKYCYNLFHFFFRETLVTADRHDVSINIFCFRITGNVNKWRYRPVNLWRDLIGSEMFHKSITIIHKKWEEHRAYIIRKLCEYRSYFWVLWKMLQKVSKIFTSFFNGIVNRIMKNCFQ